MKIIVQRLVKIWVEESYDVEDLSEDTLEDVIMYNIEGYDIEPLWETQEDLGPVEIYDNSWKLIKSINNE